MGHCFGKLIILPVYGKMLSVEFRPPSTARISTPASLATRCAQGYTWMETGLARTLISRYFSWSWREIMMRCYLGHFKRRSPWCYWIKIMASTWSMRFVPIMKVLRFNDQKTTWISPQEVLCLCRWMIWATARMLKMKPCLSKSS